MPVPGGVTAARGFLAAGVAVGIKPAGPDLALILSTRMSSGAAVFTCNRVQAAPVILSRKQLQLSGGRIQAVLLNSGCANACTGKQGMRDAILSARTLAAHLALDAHCVLLASTGVIGVRLPLAKLLAGIPSAIEALSRQGGSAAMRAIMTTDTREKLVAVEGWLAGKPVRIGGIAKGAGMIHPNLATMLSVITTDAGIRPSQLDRILRRVVERTFHCLTVDGDTSTNDTVVVLANGASGASIDRRSAAPFEEGLEIVCGELAKQIARDGEGATKLVEILVRGARTFEEARRVGKAIADSPLVKTALYGEELNWGRILCAAGYSGVRFNPDRVRLKLNGIPIFENGAGAKSTYSRAVSALKSHEVRLELNLRAGRCWARIWTCDLSHRYIDINASYIS